jgi:hypothetical protein
MSYKSSAMLTSAIVVSYAGMSASIARFIGMKIRKRCFSAPWQRSPIAVIRIPAVINVAPEMGRPVEPRPSADKDATNKPVRPIVAVGSTVVGRIGKVPIGAHRRNADTDSYLSLGFWRAAHQEKCESKKSERFPTGRHGLTPPAESVKERHPVRLYSVVFTFGSPVLPEKDLRPK